MECWCASHQALALQAALLGPLVKGLQSHNRVTAHLRHTLILVDIHSVCLHIFAEVNALQQTGRPARRLRFDVGVLVASYLWCTNCFVSLAVPPAGLYEPRCYKEDGSDSSKKGDVRM